MFLYILLCTFKFIGKEFGNGDRPLNSIAAVQSKF